MLNKEKVVWSVVGLMVGMSLMYFLQQTPSARAADAAAENKPVVNVLVDEKEMRWGYANAYRIHTSEQEAIIDFGINMPNPNVKSGENQQVLLKISDRMVISYVTAKRMSLSLATLVKRYEDRYGEIPTAPPKER